MKEKAQKKAMVAMKDLEPRKEVKGGARPMIRKPP